MVNTRAASSRVSKQSGRPKGPAVKSSQVNASTAVEDLLNASSTSESEQENVSSEQLGWVICEIKESLMNDNLIFAGTSVPHVAVFFRQQNQTTENQQGRRSHARLELQRDVFQLQATRQKQHQPPRRVIRWQLGSVCARRSQRQVWRPLLERQNQPSSRKRQQLQAPVPRAQALVHRNLGSLVVAAKVCARTRKMNQIKSNSC